MRSASSPGFIVFILLFHSYTSNGLRDAGESFFFVFLFIFLLRGDFTLFTWRHILLLCIYTYISGDCVVCVNLRRVISIPSKAIIYFFLFIRRILKKKLSQSNTSRVIAFFLLTCCFDEIGFSIS